MNDIVHIKIYLVEDKLVVAQTMREALAIWTEYMELHRDPKFVKQVGNGAAVFQDYDALIRKQK